MKEVKEAEVNSRARKSQRRSWAFVSFMWAKGGGKSFQPIVVYDNSRLKGPAALNPEKEKKIASS